MQNNEIKKQLYEKRKALYETNKQLSEIDPNLIILIKLKWLESMACTLLPCSFAYFYLFKNMTKTKRKIILLSGFLFVNYHIYRYYSEELPHIFLKHAKESDFKGIRNFDSINKNI